MIREWWKAAYEQCELDRQRAAWTQQYQMKEDDWLSIYVFVHIYLFVNL